MAHILWLTKAVLRILVLPPAGTTKPPSLLQAQMLAKNIITDHLRAVYRCLSSGQAICQVAALELLEALSLDSISVALLVATVDLTHKGLAQAARMHKTVRSYFAPSGRASPRQAYTAWVVRTLDVADYETRVSLSKQPGVLGCILNGLAGDDVASVQRILTSVLERLVFNEEENRNLPVAFLRNGPLLAIARLCSSDKADLQGVSRDFFRRCFGTANKGLCYPADPYTLLRNRLLADIVALLDLSNDNVREFAVELMRSCPDVAWHVLTSNRFSLDLSNSTSFALGVSLAIKLLALCSAGPSIPADGLFPKTISRSTLTRAIGHEDPLIKFNALMLLVALLKRCPDPPGGPSGRNPVRTFVPDFRSVLQSWRQKGTQGEGDGQEVGEVTELIERCFLEIIYHYLRLALSEDAAAMLTAADIWKSGASAEVATAALQVCEYLNPVTLLNTRESVKILTDLCQQSPEMPRARTIERWIIDSGASEDLKVARHLSRRTDCIDAVLLAIHDIYQKPLMFPAGHDPLCSSMAIDPADLEVPASSSSEEEEEEELEQGKTADAKSLAENPAKRRRVQEINLDTVLELPLGDGPISLIHGVLSKVRRVQILESLSDISPASVMHSRAPASNEDLIKALVWDLDFCTWLRLLASGLSEEDASQKIDLRLLADSGVMGFPIIGLSVADESLRRLSHLVLSRFTDMLQASRVKERRQLVMLLTALAAQQTTSAPFAPLARGLAYFYAEALPVMLRPDHPLYRPLLELHLAESILSLTTVFTRLFFDTNDEWCRQIGWLVGTLDRAAGRAGQFVGSCGFEALHVADNLAVLLQSTGVEYSVRKLAERLLTKCKPDWLAPLLMVQARTSVTGERGG